MQDLNKFDPTIEKLQLLVSESSSITKVDINDPKQIELVKKARIKLRDARVLIEKTGKSYRDEAIQYQRAVIEKERSLIAIIEPEEQRLKAFEEESKKQKELHLRHQQLPARMERLKALGVVVAEEYVMQFDSVAFETKINELVAEKNAREREENERKQREIQEAAAAVVRARVEARTERLYAMGFLHRGNTLTFEDIIVAKSDLESEDPAVWDALIARITPLVEQKKVKAKERAERERKEAEDRARQEERDRIERQAREKKEKEERDAKAKADREAREKAEIEGKKAYKKFLADNGYTPKTAAQFKEERTAEGIVLWKKVGVFKI